MSVPLSECPKLRAIESALSVEVKDGVACLRVIAHGERSIFFVRMPTAIWREFCKRQLAVPPPLPSKQQETSS
jgi:hypothetical protein